MALTVDEIAYLKSRLGSGIDLVDLAERVLRLPSLDAVVVEVLDQRVADLLAKPASFSVSGEYSQDQSSNIKALQAQADYVRIRIPRGLEVVRVNDPESVRYGR